MRPSNDPCYNDRVLSACIVNWNTNNELRACLRALAAHPYTGPGGQEIVVVDNASEDGSADMVRAKFPHVRLLANAANENYARGTNQALAAASGDLLLLLNPDVEVTPGALDTLAAFLQAQFDAAAAAPRLVHPDGRVQASVRGFPGPVPLLCDIFGLARVFPGSRRMAAYRMPFFDYGRPGPAPQPMASCLLLPRAAFEFVGPMDERFPLFFNDVDWCLRAWQAGRSIYYTPDAHVVHLGGASTGKVRAAAVWESHRALLEFYKKHYRRRTSPPLYHLVRAVVTLGAWARTGRWGKRFEREGNAGSADMHRELERPRGPADLPR
uniref:Glycosyltransferase 2-like domain-containing protein n=1 Tax=uncultured Armatimonadetes bacterium TaxID=157466 RepID=A0A6J4JLI8_9BACT|nr:hypothetical protein AVDCRST_MAG63-3642 [uncultured Armatimonadetes bacterium]